MSRLRISLLLSAVLALAIALAACGGGGGSSESPQSVLDRATFKGIESGNLDLSLSVNAKGGEGGNLDVSLSGPFQGEGGEKLPQLDLKAKANGSINGEDINFDGGLVLLPSTAYVEYKGVEYEVDPTTLSYVKSMLKQAQQQGGEGAGGASACQEAASDLKVSDFVKSLSNEGSADVGGTGTTKVSGDLDVGAAIEALVKLAENPACKAQLGSTGGALPSPQQLEKAKGEVAKAVKTAHADVYVGEDNIVRRISAQLTIEPPAGSGGGAKSVDLSFDLTLTGVNEKQTIEAPASAKPLSELFLKLGINPVELLGSTGGAGGLGSLLEKLGGAAGGMGASGGGGGGSQQAYLKCIQHASTPVDLQKCAGLLK